MDETNITVLRRYALYDLRMRRILEVTFESAQRASQSPLYRHFGKDYKIIPVDLHLNMPS